MCFKFRMTVLQENLENKPICRLGTICLPALNVLPLALFDLTCFLMSNFWVAHENYSSSESTAGMSNE